MKKRERVRQGLKACQHGAELKRESAARPLMRGARFDWFSQY